jgi:uncharacterized protein YjbJ (UPF0337 family)
MISQQELVGGWNQIKGQLKEKWGQLTDSELNQAEGNVERLVGMIQQRTGAARREVEAFFDQFAKDGANTASRVASTARQYAQQAGDALNRGYEDVSERVQEGYEQAEEMIRSRPAESLSVAFGAGIITGILVTLLMRSSR